MIPRPTASIPVRIALRLEENFFRKPLREKVRFTGYALRWVLAQLHGRFIARRAHPPRSAEQAQASAQVQAPPQAKILRVAVHGTGSIGDFLTHMLFIQTFYKTYGPMEIDFFCHQKKIAESKFVFGNTPFIKNVIPVTVLDRLKPDYDLVVYLRYLVKYEIVNHSRILAANPELFNVIEIAAKRYEPYDYVFNQHPHLDGLFARHVGLQRMNLADITGYLGNLDVDRDSIPYFVPDVAESDVRKKFGLEGKNYITIHHGFDTSYIALSSPVTKCWPLPHWNEFVRRFKARFPDIMVVQIGAHHSDRIEGADISLVNKTSLSEAAWLIKHALLHVDGESGLVRMARALHTTALVLFGPTSPSFFAFSRNINIVSSVCNDCWWSTQDWMSACPRGLKVPECMHSIKPQQVVDAAAHYLAGLNPAQVELASAALYGENGTAGEATAELLNRLKIPAGEAQANSAQQWELMAARDAIEKIESGEQLQIADVGSSRSALPAYLAKLGHHVTAIDHGFAADDVGLAWRVMTGWAANKVGLAFGSPLNIPAENETYDVVLLLGAVAEVPNKADALREAIRVLKPGGHFVFTFALMPEAHASYVYSVAQDPLTTARLRSCLGELRLKLPGFSAADIDASRQRIARDALRDVPDGAALGIAVIKKL